MYNVSLTLRLLLRIFSQDKAEIIRIVISINYDFLSN
jgi:hypothetical protein